MTLEGKEIESDIEDDLYRIANGIEKKLLTDGERQKRRDGELSFKELKEIIARADYTTAERIAEALIKCFEKANMEHEKEIANLEKQKITNGIADELNARLCSLAPNENLEKALKYERSIQKSIFQNLIMLKKLQDVF